jgi:hypothetical protein
MLGLLEWFRRSWIRQVRDKERRRVSSSLKISHLAWIGLIIFVKLSEITQSIYYNRS